MGEDHNSVCIYRERIPTRRLPLCGGSWGCAILEAQQTISRQTMIVTSSPRTENVYIPKHNINRVRCLTKISPTLFRDEEYSRSSNRKDLLHDLYHQFSKVSATVRLAFLQLKDIFTRDEGRIRRENKSVLWRGLINSKWTKRLATRTDARPACGVQTRASSCKCNGHASPEHVFSLASRADRSCHCRHFFPWPMALKVLFLIGNPIAWKTQCPIPCTSTSPRQHPLPAWAPSWKEENQCTFRPLDLTCYRFLRTPSTDRSVQHLVLGLCCLTLLSAFIDALTHEMFELKSKEMFFEISWFRKDK